MLYTGVPGYRLSRELIRAEVEVIQSLGVEIRCNTQIGKDVSFVDLRRDFAAVIIACGANPAGSEEMHLSFSFPAGERGHEIGVKIMEKQ